MTEDKIIIVKNQEEKEQQPAEVKKSAWQKTKEFFKSFTLYQIIYLSSVVLLVGMFAIFFPEEMLEDMSNTFVVVCSVIAVLANPVCELLISKQSKWNFIVSILFIEVTESILCFYLGYYSTAIISLVFWIPIDLASFINWHKHKDEEEEILTKVKRLTWKQDIFVILAIAAFGFGVGYLLTLIPGAEDTYIDAFTSAVGMSNGILLLLRYNEQWIAWLICLVLEFVLYCVSGSYIMLITVVAMFVNTVYGFVKWYIYTKKHPELKEQAKE